jgi:hypothetical protein
MATVASTLECVKNQLHKYLPESLIEEVCRQQGHRWRRRKFDPVVTLQLFVLQVLSFNTAITHLRHLAGMPVNAAAYCRARMRLPVGVLAKLLEHSASAIDGRGEGAEPRRWCSLRAFLVDASSAIAPDTPNNQKHFPQPRGQKKGCGFPVPKLLGLFDAFRGVVVQVVFSPLYTHDLRGMPALHPMLQQGDLLVGDRACCFLVHKALLQSRQVAALFRMHASRITSFPDPKRPGRKRPPTRIVKKLGRNDRLVSWTRPTECNCPSWMTLKLFRKLPETLPIRELRWSLVARGQRTRTITIATTLLDPTLYPAEKIRELYGVRWSVETHFGELKTTLKMRRIKCRTAQGLQKEMLVFCLVYNLVHALMLQAAATQNVTPDRISFLDSLRWLLSARPGQTLPLLRINKNRQGRHQPRVVKDRHDGYQRMTVPRSKMNRHPEKWTGRK